jgi:hypothetical protein
MKMHKSQTGAGHLVLIVTVIVIAAVGFAGWKVYTTQSNKSQNNYQSDQSKTQETEKSEAKTDETVLKPGEIVKLPEGGVRLVYPADLSKLPATVPQSFKDYMLEKLKKNEASGDCVGLYTVNMISTVNISGGVGDASRTTLDASDSCGGGAHIVWSHKNGEWHETGFQAIDYCNHLVEVGIYSEFMETCYDGSTEKEATNPLGSIKQLAQE